MRTYIGEGRYVPGVPARDLSEEEWSAALKAGLLTDESPAAALWEKPSKKDVKEVSDGKR